MSITDTRPNDLSEPGATALPLPLAGITVVDFTQVFMGPSATQMLGDFGADIIKIERPGLGDIARNSFPDKDGQDNPIFLSINRNKRSLSIDTREEEGRAVLRRIIAEADVVVSNFRHGVIERMGFGYEELSRENRGLIWASGTGFGNEGPNAHKGGQDAIAQAYSGVMWRRESPEIPLSMYPTTLCDYTTGCTWPRGSCSPCAPATSRARARKWKSRCTTRCCTCRCRRPACSLTAATRSTGPKCR